MQKSLLFRRSLVLVSLCLTTVIILGWSGLGAFQGNASDPSARSRDADVIAEEWYDAVVLLLGMQLLTDEEATFVKERVLVSESMTAIAAGYYSLSAQIDKDGRALGAPGRRVCIRNVTISLVAKGSADTGAFSLLDGPHQERVFDTVDMARMRQMLRTRGIANTEWMHIRPIQLQEAHLGSVSGLHRLVPTPSNTPRESGVSCKVWITYEITALGSSAQANEIIDMKTKFHDFVYANERWQLRDD